MSKSGTPKLSDQVACLFMHFPIVCRECGYRIEWDEQRDWDHLIEEADGGEHHPRNFRPIHSKSIGCHRRKSRRKEAERHGIQRLEEKRQLSESRASGELTYTKYAFEKPKAKIQSRPFMTKQQRREFAARVQERR